MPGSSLLPWAISYNFKNANTIVASSTYILPLFEQISFVEI